MTWVAELAVSIAGSAVRGARRAYCAATLGHDADWSRPIRTESWTIYPCRKCGQPLLPSLWSGLPGAPTDVA